ALQLGARGGGVALVEDQVQHLQDDAQPLLALGRRWQRERRLAGLDLLLGAADPLAERRLRDEERARDLAGRQAADGAQRERDLGGRRQRRVAAEERQREGVVAGRRTRGLVLGRGGEQLVGGRQRRHRHLAAPPGLVAAELVGQPAGGDGDQPGA